MALANFCDLVRGRGNMYHLLGRESDREVAKRMFKYLYDAAVEVAAHEAKAYRLTEGYRNQLYQDKTPAVVIRTFLSGFKLGFAIAVKHRLDEEREGARKQLEVGPAEEVGTALVRLDQIELQREEFKHEQFPKLTSGPGVKTRSSDGYERGKQYGASVGINANKRLK